MKKDLVSIIVGIYNGEKYINKCINSILNQSYDNIEVILIDDGSTDNSKVMLDDFQKRDSRVQVIHQQNMGVSKTRNKGIDISNGDYICIVDQDDWLDLDYIEYLLKLIHENNCSIALIPQVIFSTEEISMYKDKHEHNCQDIVNGEQAALDMFYGKIEIGPWNKMISKKLLIDNSIKFHDDLFGGEGYCFSIESFYACSNIAYGYNGKYHYRYDNYSSEMSSFKPRTAISSFKAVEYMKKQFYNVSDKSKRAIDYAYWNAYYTFFRVLVENKFENKYSNEYNEWKKILKNKFAYVTKSDISKSDVIKRYFFIHIPKTMRFVKSIRNKFKKNISRDYSKVKK